MLVRIQNHPFLLWFGAGLLVAAIVVQLTDEFDPWVLYRMAERRSPVLNNLFINLTALGSATLIALHTLIAFALLISTRDKVGALQLVIASAGSETLTQLTKGFVERPRPTMIPALVDATGYSFPSGHAVSSAAMYVTIAILASRHLRLRRQRILLVVLTVIIVSGVAMSRVYVGVHYFTDALTGMFLGTAWAFFVAAVVSRLEKK
jgi:undecaprenyl-diphosphatase